MCMRQCQPKDHTRANKQGWRNLIFYPKGGTYRGYWQENELHRFGEKVYASGLIYRGGFKNDKRHGHGLLFRKHPNDDFECIYVGNWENDTKCGEGKQFYIDGIYYGMFYNNRRHGLGLFWRKDGSLMYLGEWKVGVRHGIGTYFYLNGNRYEGNFARGYKNGEGTYYHMSTGQIQKGMWDNDICKSSMVIDDFKNAVLYPTTYPIPVCGIAEADRFIRKIFKDKIENANRPTKPFVEALSLNFVKKWKKYAKLQSSGARNTQICDADLKFQCTCSKIDVPPVLCENKIESQLCILNTCKKASRYHFCFESKEPKK